MANSISFAGISTGFFALGLMIGFSSRLNAQETTPTPISSPASVPTTQTLAAETQFKTLSGGVFKVPKGWSVSNNDGIFLFQAPDSELVAALVEDHKSQGEDAIRSAWKTAAPKHYKEVTDATDYRQNSKSPGDWEEAIRFNYHITPEGGPVAWADARKKGHVCYVFLIYGSKAVVDRRTAQLNLIHDSLTLPGFAGDLFKGMKAYTLDSDRAKSFEDFIEYARDKCKIPGTAVAVVQNGQVVYEKGFGVCEKGKAGKVTPQTLFMIGSVTKPLSSLMLARLVDRGTFTWNTRVVKIMPRFRLGDKKTTQELTMKNTFCACVGLPREDMELVFDTAKGTPEGLMDQIGKLVPTTGLGETFQYSNQMAAAGGYIAAHALYPKKPLGQAYDEAMQSQVFDPLGMKDSTLDANNASQKDHATPHEWDLGGNCVSVSLSSEHWTAPVRPAMGVWSSIDDMTRYLLMELSKGKGPDGSVVVSKENLLKRREPQAKMSDKSSYGLGLIVSDNHGLDYFGHDGTVTGFTSSMAFYPDLGIGIIILANVDKSELFTNGVRARLLEILFDKKPKIQDELNEAWDKKSSHDRLVDYFSDFKDEDFFRKLKGDYSNENLGPISIQFKDRGVYLVTDGWTVPLASFKRGKDTVDSIILGGPPMIGVQMKVNENKGHVLLTLETPQKDYVFDQIAPEKGK